MTFLNQYIGVVFAKNGCDIFGVWGVFGGVGDAEAGEGRNAACVIWLLTSCESLHLTEPEGSRLQSAKIGFLIKARRPTIRLPLCLFFHNKSTFSQNESTFEQIIRFVHSAHTL